MSNDGTLETLQLVTTRRPFFEQQVRILEQHGVSCTVIEVPGSKGERSVLDYARFQAEVLRRSLTEEFDLVQANYGLTGPIALAQPQRPVVLSLWGSELQLQARYSRPIAASARFADAVTVASEPMARRLDRECHVVPWGIDTELFSPQPRAAAREELGWDPDARHVLFPYDPERPIKNYPRAKSVVEAVDDDFEEDVELQVVHGVAHERIPTYLNAADALVLTSTSEGSPNAVKEALACNVPVVSVDVGDVADLLDGIANCHVRDTDEGLARKLADVLRSGQRADGRESMAEHSLDAMARNFLSVYEEVLDGRAVPTDHERIGEPTTQ